jgi:hypothetical protein
LVKGSFVFVVPDTFGSHLADADGRVWLEPTALSAAEVDRLAIDRTLQTKGVNAAIYRPLVEALGQANDVEAFEYDWRRSARVGATVLLAQVRARIESEHRSMHFVAHGAGGLVLMAMVADAGDDLTKHLLERGSRFVLLGVPMGGSWEIVRMLAGRDPLARHVEKIAGSASFRFIEILRACPGLLEQLPAASAAAPSVSPGTSTGASEPWAWYREDLWGDAPPDAAALGEALEFRRWLAGCLAVLRESRETGGPTALNRLLVVAGVGVPTCVSASLSRGSPEFLYTADGDGRVLADLADVQGARGSYVEASHAELIRSADLLRGYAEMLNSGESAILLRTPPPALADAPMRAREAEPSPAPTQVDLAEAAVGALARKTVLAFPLRVCVAHGHLREAAHPVAVGHYRGDSLVSAEALLDDALDGALRQRFDVDAYPGPEGSVEIIRIPGGHPPGAIIIGMGDVSDLNPSLLRRVFSNAAVRYALRAAEGWRPGERWRSAAFSTLLVGTGGGAAGSLAECIVAIVAGAVDANRHPRKSRALWERARIDAVEFVEVFEDVAIQAARAVCDLPRLMAQELRPSEEIAPALELDARRGASSYMRPTPIAKAGGGVSRCGGNHCPPIPPANCAFTSRRSRTGPASKKTRSSGTRPSLEGW